MTSTSLKPLSLLPLTFTSEKDQHGDHQTLRPIVTIPKITHISGTVPVLKTIVKMIIK